MALFPAIRRGDVQGVNELIERGADVNATMGSQGSTPLIVAAKCGQTAVVAVLVAAGALIEHSGLAGWTALHVACAEGHLGTVQHLVTRALANVVARTNEGWSPYACAARGGHLHVMQVLEDHGALRMEAACADRALYRSALTAAANGGQLALVQGLIIGGGADKDGGGGGYTPLAEAARGGHVAVVNYLALAAADLNSRGGGLGLSPLIAAAYGNHATVVATLLAHGADASCVDDAHGTALHVAAGAAYTDVMRCLLAHPGCDVNALDRYRRTPLHVAVRKVSRCYAHRVAVC